MSETQIASKTTLTKPLRGRWNRGHDRELLSEKEFRQTLDWERRRSERSGNSLLLALVHLGKPEWKDRGGTLGRTVSNSLYSVIRATDTAGWCTVNERLGVIFTDLRAPIKSGPLDSIDVKLKQVLFTTVPPEAAQPIRVTYHVFPEGDRVSGPGDSIFYPERAPRMGAAARPLKRCMDVMGSLVALFALSPLLLLITLAVKLTSRGPVWCRQTRVGQAGRTFTLLKFRSMFQNCDSSLHREYVTRMIAGENVARADRAEAAIYKIVNDPRITPIGRLLRRSSLDELPQFLNVLRGDMSLVGPRPPLPYEFDCYCSWHRRRVLEVKPGLTGLWQVYGRSRTNFDEMVRLDLRYARQWSFWLDLKILLRTPIAVIFGAGAY